MATSTAPASVSSLIEHSYVTPSSFTHKHLNPSAGHESGNSCASFFGVWVCLTRKMPAIKPKISTTIAIRIIFVFLLMPDSVTGIG